MDIEKEKAEIIITLRDIEDDARTLIERCGKARAELPFVKTVNDLREYADRHDFECGMRHIRLF